MNQVISFFTFRAILLLFSTTSSILIVMLLLNIVTVDDLIVILKLSPEAANALKLIVGRFREVSSSILDILSQLLNKLFSWAEVNVDLSKIKVDVNHINQTVPDTDHSKQ